MASLANGTGTCSDENGSTYKIDGCPPCVWWTAIQVGVSPMSVYLVALVQSGLENKGLLCNRAQASLRNCARPPRGFGRQLVAYWDKVYAFQ